MLRIGSREWAAFTTVKGNIKSISCSCAVSRAGRVIHKAGNTYICQGFGRATGPEN